MSAAHLQGSVTAESVSPPTHPFVFPRGHVSKFFCALKPELKEGITVGRCNDLCRSYKDECRNCTRPSVT